MQISVCTCTVRILCLSILHPTVSSWGNQGADISGAALSAADHIAP